MVAAEIGLIFLELSTSLELAALSLHGILLIGVMIRTMMSVVEIAYPTDWITLGPVVGAGGTDIEAGPATEANRGFPGDSPRNAPLKIPPVCTTHSVAVDFDIRIPKTGTLDMLSISARAT